MPIRKTDEHYAFEKEHGFKETKLHIDPATINWQACGETDPLTRLLGGVYIGGAYHHLEAREVWQEDKNGGPWASVEFEEDRDALETIAGDAFDEFVELEGRTYYLFMTPGS